MRTRWALRVLVGCDPNKYDVSRMPTLELDAASEAQIHGFRRLDCPIGNAVAYVLFAADFDVVLGPEPRYIEYTVVFAGCTKKFQFHVPRENDDPHMMYCSCNDVEAPSHRRPEAYKSWDHFLRSHQQHPFDLVIAGGDQIYGDACLDHQVENDYAECERFYLNEYLSRFADEAFMAAALATVPFLMQPDDHDYYNGAGSHGKREPKLARRAAHKYRFLFQLGLPASEAIGPHCFENSSRVFRVGPNVLLLSTDMRSNRQVHSKEPLMPNAVWSNILGQLRASTAADPRYAPRHLVVLFAVPLMFLANDIVVKISEKFKSVLRTDFRDSPLSYHNIKQTRHMIEDLTDFARQYSIRLTYLSGDAHVFGTGYIESHEKNRPPMEQDPRAAYQWISSPMCNDPASELTLAHPIGAIFGQTKRHLGPVDMTLYKLTAERNYMRLFVTRRVGDNDAVLNGAFVRDYHNKGEYVEEDPMMAPPLRLKPSPALSESERQERAAEAAG
jgi:hypothetical protein